MTRRDVLRGGGLAFCAQDLNKAAQEAPVQTLSGTQLLSWQGDPSERMMDGAHKYVERKIAESVKTRRQYWNRDLSPWEAQESECASLREYARVLIERTIFETKYQMGGYAIAICVLRHQTIGDGLAFKGPQHKEAMHQSMALSACINEYAPNDKSRFDYDFCFYGR